MWLYCSESPILPLEMKLRPVYLRVSYSSMHKFILFPCKSSYEFSCISIKQETQ